MALRKVEGLSIIRNWFILPVEESVFEHFPLVLLAAGKSSRMGVCKALVDVADQPLIVWQLRRYAAAGGRRAIVVLGFHAEEIGRTLHAWNSELGLEVKIVKNPAPECGSFSSLVSGLMLALEDLDMRGCFVTPVDVPAPKSEVWHALYARYTAGFSVVIPCIKERGGHPVLLDVAFAKQLCSIDLLLSEARLDLQIRRLSAAQVCRVEVIDSMVCRNLNTVEDLSSFLTTVTQGHG